MSVESLNRPPTLLTISSSFSSSSIGPPQNGQRMTADYADVRGLNSVLTANVSISRGSKYSVFHPPLCRWFGLSPGSGTNPPGLVRGEQPLIAAAWLPRFRSLGRGDDAPVLLGYPGGQRS